MSTNPTSVPQAEGSKLSAKRIDTTNRKKWQARVNGRVVGVAENEGAALKLAREFVQRNNSVPQAEGSDDVREARLDLRDLHVANKARQTEWCVGGDDEPDLAFRGNELAGETGEACNVIKNLERERHGWRGSRATLDMLAEELADVVICADLCAVTAGIDLAEAVVAKFNATSEKQGLATKLPTPDRAGAPEDARVGLSAAVKKTLADRAAAVCERVEALVSEAGGKERCGVLLEEAAVEADCMRKFVASLPWHEQAEAFFSRPRSAPGADGAERLGEALDNVVAFIGGFDEPEVHDIVPEDDWSVSTKRGRELCVGDLRRIREYRLASRLTSAPSGGDAGAEHRDGRRGSPFPTIQDEAVVADDPARVIVQSPASSDPSPAPAPVSRPSVLVAETIDELRFDLEVERVYSSALNAALRRRIHEAVEAEAARLAADPAGQSGPHEVLRWANQVLESDGEPTRKSFRCLRDALREALTTTASKLNAEAVAQAIDSVDPGYSIKLFDLTDGVSTYTLDLLDGSDLLKFEDMDDAREHALMVKSQARAEAVLALVAATAAQRDQAGEG